MKHVPKRAAAAVAAAPAAADVGATAVAAAAVAAAAATAAADINLCSYRNVPDRFRTGGDVFVFNP
jgi:hypothetical protein